MAELMKSGVIVVNNINVKEHRNKIVIIHGKVQSIKNNILNLLVDPRNNYEILVNGFRKNCQQGEFVAIMGKVASDKSLDFIDIFPLDNEFDLEYANEIATLSNHPDVKHFFERN